MTAVAGLFVDAMLPILTNTIAGAVPGALLAIALDSGVALLERYLGGEAAPSDEMANASA